uniref:Uncharacterized protein n=1 Tax=Romanomermis culicivorax TaxID=13658 RepID=A0A915JFF2_ROMCU
MNVMNKASIPNSILSSASSSAYRNKKRKYGKPKLHTSSTAKNRPSHKKPASASKTGQSGNTDPLCDL